jgi:uncharacterized protein YjbJ (UPF0337 family)
MATTAPAQNSPTATVGMRFERRTPRRYSRRSAAQNGGKPPFGDRRMGDKLRGKVDQVTGKVKEGVGRASDDHKLTQEGRGDQAKGELREAAGKVKDAAGKAKDAVRR